MSEVDIKIVVKNVAEILDEVKNLHSKAQNSEQITKILVERTAAANSAVSVLRDDDLNTPARYANLQSLVQVLQKMKKFIEVITQYNTSQKFLGTKTKMMEKNFKDLCKEYDYNVSLLNFVDFKKFNAQEEEKVMKKDIKELLKVQETLAKNTIGEILKKVTELNKTAQHNKNITKILMERTSKAYSVVNNLQEGEGLLTFHYYSSLRRLVQVIQIMEKFIEEIIHDNAVLGVKSIEKKFKELREEYDDSIKLLSFNLAIDFESNANVQGEDKVSLKFQADLAESMIVEIFNEVTGLYKTSQHNKKLTDVLMEHISEAHSAINILQARKDLFTSNYYTNLQTLVQVLQDIEEYIEEIAQYNTMQKLLKSKKIEKKILDLHKECNNNIASSFDFNAQEEDKVLKEDIKELLKVRATSVKSTITNILNEVTELNKKTQHNNKSIIKILMKRISTANSAVSILQERDDLFTSHYYTSHANLRRLVDVIKNMEKYIKEIIQQHTQYDTKQKFLEAKTIKEKFNDLCKEYENSISLLNFELKVNFNFDAQEEDKVLLNFQAALAESMIDEILNEVEKLHKTAQHNKNITKILMERISKANSVVKCLQKREELIPTSDCYTSLQKLVQVLQDMKKYIEEITQYNAVQKFLKSKTIKDIFEDLCKKYDDNISCISLKKLDKFPNEDKFLKEDIEELSKFQETLAENMTDMNMDQIFAVTTAIYFELFAPLIKDMAEILSNIMSLYCTAQHNKKIIQILIGRIAAANSAFNTYILRDEYTSKDYANLQKLVQVLKDMDKFIEEIAKGDAVQIEKKFKDLRKEYDDSISLLSFVDFKEFNAQEEDKILKKDIEIKQKVTNPNDKMKLVVEVSEMAMVMENLIKRNTDQSKIDNVFHEYPLRFEDYKETGDDPRSDRLRKYVNVKTKKEFAFKTIKNEHINQVKNQVIILKKLEYCHNIIHFYGHTHDKNRDKYYLVTEWAENVNLREYISRHKQTIETKFRLRFACNIANGLNFLNAAKILHRDIRSENIVITDRDVAKITNFNVDTGNLVINKDCIRYRAPEMLSKGEEAGKNENETKYDTKCEVYSFGILLWEIAEFRIPYEQFEDFEEIAKKVISGHQEPLPFTESTAIPEKYQSLVREAVNKNPDLRPTFAKMLIKLQEIFKEYIPVRLSSLIKNAIKEEFIKYIKWNELTDISIVGSGHFGSVFRARRSTANDYVVFKKLNNSQEDAYQHEIKMQIKAHCENIIRFIGVTQETPNDDYCIVMEYANRGNLREYLKSHPLNWVDESQKNQKYQLAFDITNGLHYLHKENIIHRDLHAKNIVIHKDQAKIQAKIIDFGYAKNVNDQNMINGKVYGMTPYVAPEILKISCRQLPPFSKKTDIYSLGVLFWEISSGKPPFQNHKEELTFNIVNGLREIIIENTPYGYYNLYTACWEGEPEKRPTIEYVYGQLKSVLPKDNKIIDSFEEPERSSSEAVTDNIDNTFTNPEGSNEQINWEQLYRNL